MPLSFLGCPETAAGPRYWKKKQITNCLLQFIEQFFGELSEWKGAAIAGLCWGFE